MECHCPVQHMPAAAEPVTSSVTAAVHSRTAHPDGPRYAGSAQQVHCLSRRPTSQKMQPYSGEPGGRTEKVNAIVEDGDSIAGDSGLVCLGGACRRRRYRIGRPGRCGYRSAPAGPQPGASGHRAHALAKGSTRDGGGGAFRRRSATLKGLTRPTDERRRDMTHAQTLAVCVGIVCSTHGLDAQDLSRYRNFELGSTVASVSTVAGVASSAAKTIHRRPALLHDLEYRPSRWIAESLAPSTDPVQQIVFSFYNDQLFRIVVDYSRERTEGMTPADLIDGIVAVYGPVLPPASRARGRVPSRLETEAGSPIAQWGDSQHSVVLYHTSSYGAAFRLLVTDVRLDDLARAAEAQALRLDAKEAPQREVARQQQERADGLAAAEKARVVNKGEFRP